jgi:hypothetical protein
MDANLNRAARPIDARPIDARADPFASLPVEPEVQRQLETRYRRRGKRTARQREYDASRCKATYDLTDELIDTVLHIANDIRCSQSDVVMHLLAAGIAQYRAGRLDLKGIRRPHRMSLRFEFKLDPPKVEVSS